MLFVYIYLLNIYYLVKMKSEFINAEESLITDFKKLGVFYTQYDGIFLKKLF
jgi:hypothetical protein